MLLSACFGSPIPSALQSLPGMVVVAMPGWEGGGSGVRSFWRCECSGGSRCWDFFSVDNEMELESVY